ncbi:MAG: hypothetical protein M1401_06335 [Chloroflexi bacterium]|nr:hypothetical protein [Actinomycetota bacterium]MCL5108468.1 hypothetical protein [Chloroflexota bacterium]
MGRLLATLGTLASVGALLLVLPSTAQAHYARTLGGKYQVEVGFLNEPPLVGTYIFRFSGQIEGLNVDERFESGPGRFDEVTAAQGLQFPDKLPSAEQTAADLSAARAAADTATTLAIAGVALAVLGLGLAAVALLRRPAGKGEGQTV